MKIFLLNLIILMGIVGLYYIGMFDLIGNQYFRIFAFSLVVIMFIIGFFVVGNPFNGKKK